MFKRIASLCLLLCFTLPTGCYGQRKHTVTWYDAFDTPITLTGYAPSQAAFDRTAAHAHAEFLRLHAIFDRYSPASDVSAYNRGQRDHLAPELDELLAFCDSLFDKTGKRLDPRMGAVLDIWHEYREQGTEVPPSSVLKEAAIDRTQLDLGAVAKGWAVERVARLIRADMPSFLIDAGGNIRAGDPPPDGRHYWTVGVQDPQQSGIVATLAIANLSVVTSGGYQRFYEVDGVRYHHLIDPDTLMPGGGCLQATVLTEDSALADYLSTAAFLLPYGEARALIDAMDGVEAIWVLDNGACAMTDGAKIRATNGA